MFTCESHDNESHEEKQNYKIKIPRKEQYLIPPKIQDNLGKRREWKKKNQLKLYTQILKEIQEYICKCLYVFKIHEISLKDS